MINALLMGALLGGAFALVYLVWQKGLRDAFKKVFCDMLALFVFGVGPESEMEMVMPYCVFASRGAFLALFCEVIRIAAYQEGCFGCRISCSFAGGGVPYCCDYLPGVLREHSCGGEPCGEGWGKRIRRAW